MSRVRFSILFMVSLISLKAWANPIRMKLQEIRAESDGALITTWEEISGNNNGISTNSIFVVGLPEDITTGDTWEGVVERSGAYTMTNGFKIPRYLVANSGLKNDKNINTSKLDIENDVFLVKTDSGRGSAFRCLIDGKSYIFTNLHVVDGASTIEIQKLKGAIVALPNNLEISKEEDLVRFPVEAEGGLKVQSKVSIGDHAIVYGNSQGSDVITELKGKVLGVGPKTFEVSCPFVTGNSGGPVIGESGEVMGVASFLTFRENKWDQKTRFAEVRRFAINLQEKQSWVSMPLPLFQKESKVLADASESLDQIVDLAFLYGKPFIAKSKITSPTGSGKKAQGKVDLAIDSYNNGKLTARQKCWLFFGSLAEACEAIPEDSRECWATDWSKDRYKKMCDQSAKYALEIRAYREELGRAINSSK